MFHSIYYFFKKIRLSLNFYSVYFLYIYILVCYIKKCKDKIKDVMRIFAQISRKTRFSSRLSRDFYVHVTSATCLAHHNVDKYVHHPSCTRFSQHVVLQSLSLPEQLPAQRPPTAFTRIILNAPDSPFCFTSDLWSTP